MFEMLEKRSFDALGIGEVMLRLSPHGKERISYSEVFEKMAGGSELNVVGGISMLGLRTGIITKLPKNEIGKYIKNKIRYTGTSDDYIIYDTGDKKRLGVYYYESGAYPRLPIALYDRRDSSFTTFRKEEVSESVYSSTSLFHTSGITLAISREISENVVAMMKRFRESGALVSFDVNYRSSLWSEDLARETVSGVLPLVDILFVSEETSRRMFRMTGSLREIQRAFCNKYKSISVVASTKRRVISAQKQSFSSLIYDARSDVFYEDVPYKNVDVVDRIGSGDAYVAGALYGLLAHRSIKAAAKYGDAMAVLKNTIFGDMTVCDLADIERIINSHDRTGYKDELVR